MISKTSYFTCDVEVRENVSFNINLKEIIATNLDLSFYANRKLTIYIIYYLNTDLTIFIANNASATQVLRASTFSVWL